MRGFKLTITNSDWDRNLELFRNLKTLIYGLMLPLALTIVSGFWYLWVSHDLNWNASQTILVLHLIGGLISLIMLIPFFLLHQREKKQKLRWLALPWRLIRKTDESQHQFRQRMIGLGLFGALATVYLSGILIALPGALFYFRLLLLWENATAELLGSIHLISAVLAVGGLFLHMLWLERNKQQVIADEGKITEVQQ